MDVNGLLLAFGRANDLELAIAIDIDEYRILGTRYPANDHSRPFGSGLFRTRIEIGLDGAGLLPRGGDIDQAIAIDIGQAHAIGTLLRGVNDMSLPGTADQQGYRQEQKD